MIGLFTDFGPGGLYTGQVRAVLAREAPGVEVIELMNDAPRFAPRAAAHLLAALAPRLPAGAVVLGVVDPGVGTGREPWMVRAGGRWYVGPGNGLFDVACARAGEVEAAAIEWRPTALSASFHGRDLFAPVAARLARGESVAARPVPAPACSGADLAEVIYVDGYGNAATGLRAAGRGEAALVAGEHRVERGTTFGEVAEGSALWYENSLGLVEIAVNRGDAARALGLRIGTRVEFD